MDTERSMAHLGERGAVSVYIFKFLTDEDNAPVLFIQQNTRKSVGECIPPDRHSPSAIPQRRQGCVTGGVKRVMDKEDGREELVWD